MFFLEEVGLILLHIVHNLTKENVQFCKRDGHQPENQNQFPCCSYFQRLLSHSLTCRAWRSPIPSPTFLHCRSSRPAFVIFALFPNQRHSTMPRSAISSSCLWSSQWGGFILYVVFLLFLSTIIIFLLPVTLFFHETTLFSRCNCGVSSTPP